MSTSARLGYSALLSLAGARVAAVTALVARLPTAMMSVTLVLLAGRVYGTGNGALCAALYTAGLGAFGPLRARAADRRGLKAVVGRLLPIYVSLLIAVAALVLFHAPRLIVLAGAALAGASIPPLAPSIRAYWLTICRDRADLQAAAMSLDTACLDTGQLGGPALAGVICTVASPEVSIGAIVALVFVSALVLTGRRTEGEGPRSTTHRERGATIRILPVGRLRWLLLLLAAVNVALADSEVSVIGIARLRGAPSLSGILVAGFAAGSILSGLAYGRTEWAQRPRAALPVLLGMLCGTLLLLASASSSLALVAICTPLVGMVSGPALAAVFLMASRDSPAQSKIEAQAWLNSSMAAGWAAGAGIAAVFARRPQDAILSGAALALITAGATLANRRKA